MFKQRWRIWLGALVVVIIVSGVVIFREIWRSEPVDPRAYAVDSGEISLKEGLARAEISLPECAEDDLRYAFIDDGFEYYCKIYLKLEESRGCINEFLEKNAMVDVLQVGTIGGAESEYRIEVRSIWMDSYPVFEMGWKLGRNERFQEFTVGKANLYALTALVQHIPGSRKYRAYIHAFRGG